MTKRRVASVHAHRLLFELTFLVFRRTQKQLRCRCLDLLKPLSEVDERLLHGHTLQARSANKSDTAGVPVDIGGVFRRAIGPPWERKKISFRTCRAASMMSCVRFTASSRVQADCVTPMEPPMVVPT